MEIRRVLCRSRRVEDDVGERLGLLGGWGFPVLLQELVRGELLVRFSQRHKSNALWGQCFISERALQGVQVVGADGDQRSATAQVLVQLVLQLDEAVVDSRRELHASQNSRSEEHTSELQSLMRISYAV